MSIETTDPSTAPSAVNRPVASRIHTLVVLAAIIAWALLGKGLADGLSTELHPNRVRFYLISFALEWLMFALVVSGVLRARVALSAVIGAPWRSWRGLLVDIGIAAAFWILGALMLNVLGRLLRITGVGSALQAVIPRSVEEMALWVVLSVTAGICEETIFRGYLQPQLIVLSGSRIAGILLGAAAFGAGHAYQGGLMVILISLYGAMFGALAYWRRSVRPGMIAHAWHDAFTGILAASMLRP